LPPNVRRRPVRDHTTPCTRHRGRIRIPHYSVYGLTLASNLALFGLPAAPPVAAADVALVLGDAPPWAHLSRAAGAIRYRTPPAESGPDDNLIVFECAEGFLFRYADGTEFHLSRDGRDVWATWAPASTLQDTETYLLGPVLGFAQRLRGVLCLHASAVVVAGRAIALCGPSEAGKSTTAGAFAAAGHGVLADDMTAIHEVGGRSVAMPAYDHLRLWEESERILLGTSGALPRLTPTWDKRALRLRGQGWTFHNEPVELGAVVLLAPREAGTRAPRVEAVAPGDAFLAIAANSYANYLLDGPMRGAEFASIARLLAHVTVVRATPHADAERIGDLVARIAGAGRP
jgi:hypothetical protein